MDRYTYAGEVYINHIVSLVIYMDDSKMHGRENGKILSSLKRCMAPNYRQRIVHCCDCYEGDPQ